MTNDEFYDPYDGLDDGDIWYDEPYPSEVWCLECKRPCSIVEEDYGIGPGEYWGAPFYHSQIVPVSDCCEADWSEVDPTLTEPNPDHIDESEVA